MPMHWQILVKDSTKPVTERWSPVQTVFKKLPEAEVYAVRQNWKPGKQYVICERSWSGHFLSNLNRVEAEETSLLPIGTSV